LSIPGNLNTERLTKNEGESYAQEFAFAVLFVICVPRRAGDQSTRKKQGSARNFFEEVLGQGHLDKYAEHHAKDFVAHGENHEYTLTLQGRSQRGTQALPDMKVEVNQILAERDLVAVYWIASGTNTQAGMGFPATGKKIKVDGMTIFRFKAGKICEEWSVWTCFRHASDGFNLFAAVTGTGSRNGNAWPGLQRMGDAFRLSRSEGLQKCPPRKHAGRVVGTNLIPFNFWFPVKNPDWHPRS